MKRTRKEGRQAGTHTHTRKQANYKIETRRETWQDVPDARRRDADRPNKPMRTSPAAASPAPHTKKNVKRTQESKRSEQEGRLERTENKHEGVGMARGESDDDERPCTLTHSRGMRTRTPTEKHLRRILCFSVRLLCASPPV